MTYLASYKCPNCFNTQYVKTVPVANLVTNNQTTTITAASTGSGIVAGQFLHCDNCQANFTGNSAFQYP